MLCLWASTHPSICQYDQRLRLVQNRYDLSRFFHNLQFHSPKAVITILLYQLPGENYNSIYITGRVLQAIKTRNHGHNRIDISVHLRLGPRFEGCESAINREPWAHSYNHTHIKAQFYRIKIFHRLS